MGRVLVGNRRVELSEFVGVAAHGDPVVLDTGVLKQVDEATAAAPAPVPARPDLRADDAAPVLDEWDARAVVLQVVVRLMHGRFGVRSSVIASIADLLGVGTLALPARHTVDAIVDKSGLADSITADEYSALAAGMPVLLGAATCPAYALLHLIHTADVVAALSLEAAGADLEPFAFQYHEEVRPHAGQVGVAATLRVLLKGSQFVGKRPDGDLDAFRCIPQYHGPAKELAQAVARALAIELNSAEAATNDAHGTFHVQPLLTALASLLAASALIAAGARYRADALVNHAASLGLPAPSTTMANALEELVAAEREVQAAASASVAEAANVGDDRAMCRVVVGRVARARALLQKVVDIEAEIARRSLQSRIDEKVAKHNESEQVKRKRMDDRRKTVQVQLAAKPGDERLLKQLKNLEYVPSEYKATLGAGTGPFFERLSAGGKVDVMDRDFIALVETITTASNESRKAKRPKGTRDFGRDEMMIRERVFDTIRRVFQLHGAVGIDTPVFELRETLMGKYGEDSKLIYDLADQGGEKLSLRYDLTVPFARYLASNNISSIKRYHIARVYRRDNPAMSRGRFREFYQCDFDIAGTYDLMMPDAEAVAVMCEILAALGLNFEVKLNHRSLLDAIMAVCDVPPEKFRTICSAIDKLDKEPWAVVREEMLEKGLEASSADRLEGYVAMRGQPRKVLQELQSMDAISKSAGTTLTHLATLFDYLDAFGALPYVSFDMSLARGLDYYTGVIYEAVLTDTDQVGSIAAGGRYDRLVGMFLPGNKQIPAVGVSIGIERIFTIIEQRERAKSTTGAIQATYVQALVASVGGDLSVARMRVLSELWRAGIKAEMIQKRNPYFERQLEHALNNHIPYIVLFGQDELDKGAVKVKDVVKQVEHVVPRDRLVEFLRAGLHL
ncbi:histidine--tRNA ligase [Plasmodiophora brassicae]|uniref:Histidine--tRNA ligase, cytoplasmic n=1 Tax=Plasmodiophora brassicae TaxID=37360 RepID=A0A3P3YAL4_PLABS|nr:unnamed protein product [Plasmodiophora brassicae]